MASFTLLLCTESARPKSLGTFPTLDALNEAAFAFVERAEGRPLGAVERTLAAFKEGGHGQFDVAHNDGTDRPPYSSPGRRWLRVRVR